jgi:CheY-like chemotaxis protein
MSMKVFISSTYKDLVEHRNKAVEAVERSGLFSIKMERFGARTEDATTVCREEIDDADLFVGIYAHRYGYIPDDLGLSITEQEYLYASGKSKPTFCFFVDYEYPWKPGFIESEPAQTKLAAFKERITNVCDTFTTPDDLAIKVASSIGRHIYKKAVKEKLDDAAKSQSVGPVENRDQVARRAARLSSIIEGANLLLVNDRPDEMDYLVNIYKTMRINVSIATCTDEALRQLTSTTPFDVVVSDVERDNVKDEGLIFLQKMRNLQIFVPVIFSVLNYQPERGTPAYAFGIARRVDDLLNLTFDIIDRGRG